MDAGSSKSILQTCEIDPEGDLYLEVGTLLLLVSSKVLRLASPVFDKMLSSRFKEGLLNQQGMGKPNVTLPGDDQKGVELVCRILHHRIIQVPLKISNASLYAVAVVCDKYDCVSVLKVWATTWFQYEGLLATLDGSSYDLLSAAYVFDLPEKFSLVSWSMLLQHAGNFTGFQIDEGHLPANLTMEMDVRSATIRLDLFEKLQWVLHESISKIQYKGHQCESFVMSYLEEYNTTLRVLKLLPVTGQKLTIFNILESMNRLRDVQIEGCEDAACAVCCQLDNIGLQAAMKDMEFSFRTNPKGVCLDCVKTNRASWIAKTCRYEH